MKTEALKALMEEILRALPQPLGADVIDDVFAAIETTPSLRSRYDALEQELGRNTVHTWGGYWIATVLGKTGKRQVPAKRTTLLSSYSVLDADAVPPTKKRTRSDAALLMSDYYFANKTQIPSTFGAYREDLIELILAGRDPADAFSAVAALAEK